MKHDLSGSDIDELEANLEQFISDSEPSQKKEKSLTPTQNLLLSQHAEVLKAKTLVTRLTPPVSQAIEEIISDRPALEVAGEKTPDRISNSSSPIENEKIQQQLQMQREEGRVEL